MFDCRRHTACHCLASLVSPGINLLSISVSCSRSGWLAWEATTKKNKEKSNSYSNFNKNQQCRCTEGCLIDRLPIVLGTNCYDDVAACHEATISNKWVRIVSVDFYCTKKLNFHLQQWKSLFPQDRPRHLVPARGRRCMYFYIKWKVRTPYSVVSGPCLFV